MSRSEPWSSPGGQRDRRPGAIAAVILAAGRSRRMGRPKAFLIYDGVTFLARAIATVQEAGINEIAVVCGPHNADEVGAALPGDHRIHHALNPDPDQGQISSLRAGLAALGAGSTDEPEISGTAAGAATGILEAVLVLPIDHPEVRVETVRSLVAGFRTSGRPIILPVYQGRRGHPVIFGRTVFHELLMDSGEEGARGVVHADPSRIREVAVDDPGVLSDVDTPEEYRRLTSG